MAIAAAGTRSPANSTKKTSAIITKVGCSGTGSVRHSGKSTSRRTGVAVSQHSSTAHRRGNRRPWHDTYCHNRTGSSTGNSSRSRPSSSHRSAVTRGHLGPRSLRPGCPVASRPPHRRPPSVRPAAGGPGEQARRPPDAPARPSGFAGCRDCPRGSHPSCVVVNCDCPPSWENCRGFTERISMIISVVKICTFCLTARKIEWKVHKNSAFLPPKTSRAAPPASSAPEGPEGKTPSPFQGPMTGSPTVVCTANPALTGPICCRRLCERTLLQVTPSSAGPPRPRRSRQGTPTPRRPTPADRPRRAPADRLRHQHPPRPTGRPGTAPPPPGPRRGPHPHQQGHRPGQPAPCTASPKTRSGSRSSRSPSN